MTAKAASAFRLASLPGAAALLGAALAAFAFSGTLMLLAHGGVFPARPGSGDIDAVGVALAAGSTLPLMAWRRLGTGVLALTAGFGIALAGSGRPADLLLGATAALYLTAARRHRTGTRRIVALAAGMFAAYLVATAAAQGAFPTSGMLHTGLAWTAAWFAGEWTRLSREHLADLRQRAVWTEREAERERLLATAEERARIARDLHDSAAHAISVIAVRAGAARLRDDPEHSRRALGAVEELARQTAAEIDRLVASLREDGGPVEAPVGMASLDTLIARHTAAGLDVRLHVEGRRRELGAVADQAAYRILQEALTNAARHGTGPAEIGIHWDRDRVALTVTNRAGAVGAGRPGGGHGLIGMRERAELLGGSFEAGAAVGRFRLRATIPHGGRKP